MANRSKCHLRLFTTRAILAGLKTFCLGLLMMVSVMTRAQTCGATSTALIDWSQFRFVPCHTGLNPYQNVLSPTTVGSLELLWKFKTGSTVDSSAAVANGIVYVGSDDGNLYALDASTGALVWKYPTGPVEYSSPAVVNGMVYIGSFDHNLYALDASTGAFKWKYTTGDSIDPSPAVVNGTVYMASYDHNLYALDASTGAFKWKYTTGKDIVSSPAVANGMVYIGSFDHNLYALDAGTGAFKWTYTTGSFIQSSPAVVNGVVYVGSDDENVYALDAGTGAFKWKYATGGSVNSSPAVVNGVVYVGSYFGKLYALDAGTGAFKWKYATPGVINESSPAVSNGVVYITTLGGDRTIYALDASTGAFIWKYTTGGGINSSPAVANSGTVYFGSKDHFVYAFRTPPCVSLNLLVNGSFEKSDFTAWVEGGNFQHTQVVSGPFYAYPGAEDGSFYATMGPVGSDGVLIQTFATTAGANYNFSFWLASVGDSPSDFSVFWDGIELFSQTDPNTGANWTKFSYSVTGAGSDTVTFSFRDDPGYIALDDVCIIPQ